MESVVKNCGQTVHDEVANKQTMEELKELLKVGTPQGRGPAGEGCRPLPGLGRSGSLLAPVAGAAPGVADAGRPVWVVPAPGRPQPVMSGRRRLLCLQVDEASGGEARSHLPT